MIFLFHKSKKLYRNARISQKLFLAFSTVIVIPAIIVSILFIRIQENQFYRDAMAVGSNQVSRHNEQIRTKIEIIENASSSVLTQRAFIDFIHSNMIDDGLRLVKFRQNQFEQLHNMIQNHELIHELSFYVDNPELYEIWPEIYHFNRFWPQNYWVTLREKGGAAFHLFSFQHGESTLSYYRLVRMPSLQQQMPTIMEIRVAHQEFFSDVLNEDHNNFLPLIVDATQPTRAVYNPQHQFFQQHDEKQLEQILTSVHPQLDVLQPTTPIKVKIDNEIYYAIYRYIAPIDAYIINITAHKTLVEEPRSWYAFVAGITLCVLLLIMLIVSHTTRRIFRRLERVLYSMRMVRKGNLDAKIDTGLHPFEKGDEIDEVAISYNNTLDEIKQLMTQIVDKQLIAKNAQLHSLHSQINSHFLYNALESIRMLAEVEKQPAIANALVSLGSQLRYNMQWKSDTVTIHDELTNIENYIYFINFMDGNQIKLHTDLPQHILSYTIPKMCMQPIVENCVHHAVRESRALQITISMQIEEERFLLINIKDDGIGIQSQALDSLNKALQENKDTPIIASKNGLGLENVHKRLQLYYSEECGLSVDSIVNEYTCVTIRLPWNNTNLGGW